MPTTSSWDLAVECVEEALETGVAPSLAHLGRLGQLGSLPSFIGALAEGDDPATLAADYAAERESLGLTPGEVAGELLVLGRVLDRHERLRGRMALDACLLAYFARVTDDLADRARRDPLTGLLNHLAFHARVAEEIARTRRYRGRAALVLLDLDDFKATNDRAGHLEGDRLLRAFAAALGASVRANDAAGRIGGDEFGVLLLQADELAASAFLERLRTRLPAPLAVSAGSAQLAEAAVSAERLFALADRRLYEAKGLRAA